jgi:hypothetical protein
MSGSQYTEDEYRKRKAAHDMVRENLEKCGTDPKRAKEIAANVANETDNKNRDKRKG